MSAHLRLLAGGDSANSSRPANNDMMQDFQPFPVSVIIAGFCVMSAAYLICFCCCIIQFFLRRGRVPPVLVPSGQVTRRAFQDSFAFQDSSTVRQKNDKLKAEFWSQFRNSLRKFKKQMSPSTKAITKPQCIISCPICFEEYGDPAEVMVGYIKVCGHYFHFDCIWTWLETKQTCPICREQTTLKESDIKGVALRHVKEYQESLTECETTKPEKEEIDISEYHRSSPEAGVEATESSPHIEGKPSNETRVEVEDPSSSRGGKSESKGAQVDSNTTGSKSVPTISAQSETNVKENNEERPSANRNRNVDENVHDNLAFVHGDEVV